MRHLIASLACCLLLSAPAWAQPAITAVSGSTSPGGTLILDGRGFGQHGDYGGSQAFLNAAWNDFSADISGGNLTLSNTYPSAWSRPLTGGRTSSKPWVRHAWDPSGPECCRRLGALEHWMSGNTGEVYSQFYLRCGVNVQQPGKFWRIYGDGHDIFLSITDGENLMSYSNANGTPAPTTVWSVRTGALQCESRWQKFEVYLRDTAGNDFFEVQIDGQLAFRRSSQLPDNHIPLEGSASNERQQWVTNPWGGNGHTIDFAHLVDGDFFGISDAFVDYTRARVELSDQPTWANARNKEIQIPLQWADGRISVQVNPGVFKVGQTVYAYVVDTNGAVNPSGFPIVLGGTSPPPPPPPATLSITCPASQSVTLTSGSSIPVTFAAPVAAGGTAPIAVTVQPESGSTFLVGQTPVTGTAQDSVGQTASCTFTVTVLAPPPPPPPPSGCLDVTTNQRYDVTAEHLFKLPINTADPIVNDLAANGWSLTSVRTNSNWWWWYGRCAG